MTKIYITYKEDYPACDDTITSANESGATMIYSGVAPVLIGRRCVDGTVVDEDTRGFIELEEAREEQAEPPILKLIPEDALSELSNKLSDNSVNSIAEIKQALKEFVSKIV